MAAVGSELGCSCSEVTRPVCAALISSLSPLNWSITRIEPSAKKEMIHEKQSKYWYCKVRDNFNAMYYENTTKKRVNPRLNPRHPLKPMGSDNNKKSKA